MKVSTGSPIIVDQLKREGCSWIDVAPIQLRKLLDLYQIGTRAKIERVHIIGKGDYLIKELKARKTRKPR